MTELELALANGGQMLPSGVQQTVQAAMPQSELAQALASGGRVIPPPVAAEEPGRLEALGRGALQGVSLGFSDEIAGAIESLFTDKTYAQARDESRAANEAARKAHGGYYLGGEITGGLATALVPGLNVAKGASLAAAAGKSALLGAATGLGSSEADLGKGEFGRAALDTAKAAAFGGVVGAGAQKLGKLISKAPEKAEQDLINMVVAGDGKAGSATMKVKKLVANAKDDVLDALEQKFTPEGAAKPIALADIIGKPAREVMPVLEERLEAVGSKLDPNYDVIDKATGGVSLHNIVNYLDDKVAELSKKPLQEIRTKAIRDIKNSIVNAWGGEDMAKAMEAGKRLDAMGLTRHALSGDVMIPTKDLRAVVTQLQKRGTEVINALNPGESTQVKAEMSSMMKEFIDTHLDIAGELSPDVLQAVKNVRDINKQYHGLATIMSAVEQRGQKEIVGNVSAKGHIQNLFGHGGMLGAGLMVAHGNIPGAVAAAALPKVLSYAPQAGRAATRGAVGLGSMMSRLTEAAAAGNPWAKARLAAIQGAPNAAIVGGVEGMGDLTRAGQ